jgi:hypothetical protein
VVLILVNILQQIVVLMPILPIVPVVSQLMVLRSKAVAVIPPFSNLITESI